VRLPAGLAGPTGFTGAGRVLAAGQGVPPPLSSDPSAVGYAYAMAAQAPMTHSAVRSVM